MIKNFLLDTNILLQDPSCICNGFADNNIYICGTTLQELDRKKASGGDAGYNARECIRVLDALRSKGDLLSGITLPSGGMLYIEPDGVKQEYLPDGFDLKNPDNRIISTCIHLNKRMPDCPIILVTNDISMRINASVCGINVESYRNSIVEESGYKGHIDIDVSEEIIDELYKNGNVPVPEEIYAGLLENEFVTLHCGQQSALSVHRNRALHLITPITLFGGVKPRNAMQTYAMWALKAPAEEIPLVILMGPAGTAKTFLSLAAGLDDVYVSQHGGGLYNKILISRPTAESYQEIGYLPGDLSTKLSPLLASYYDNIEILLTKSGTERECKDQLNQQINDIFSEGIVEVCGLSFIRGRSLMNSYVICDEAQNSSKTLIRDVITRAGAGTKIVIAGDPSQIDVPTLDKRNNGLVYAAEMMKGSPLAAIIQFDAANSVRSPLAREAIQRLKI